MVKQQYRFAAAFPHGPFQEPSGKRLVGYPVHVFCWEMLSHHSIVGDVAKSDLKTVMCILRQKSRDWKYGTDESEADFKFMDAKGRNIHCCCSPGHVLTSEFTRSRVYPVHSISNTKSPTQDKETFQIQRPLQYSLLPE